jgi:hypothetical protein
MIHYLLAFCILFFYIHLYLHFLVNPNHHCSVVTSLTKESITEEVYAKLPFLLDGTMFRRELDLINTDKESKKYKHYTLPYHSLVELEPLVRHIPVRTAMVCLKKKKWIETNDSCRTFYRIHKGSYHMTCIHPYKKHWTQDKKKIKDSEELIHLTLHEDSVLFLPNQWSLYIEPLEEGSTLEKIQYYTPLNLVATTISKIHKYIGDSISICSTNEPPSI